ncbi:MAG: hypothetical protein ACREAS_06725 [Nitrososphaera sp.]
MATEIIRSENISHGNALLVIHSDVGWSAVVQDSDFVAQSVDGFGVRSIELKCDGGFWMDGIFSHVVQKSSEYGVLNIYVAQDGRIIKQGGTGAAYGVVSVAGECIH